MSPEVVELERLRSWKTALEQKVAELEARMRPLSAEVEKTRNQIHLVDRLLGLETGDLKEGDNGPRIRLDSSKSVADALESILTAANQPLHISDIMQRYLAHGLTIPGKGNESNLISYLVRDERFTRISKGTYAVSQNASSGRTRDRRKKRRARRKPRRGQS